MNILIGALKYAEVNKEFFVLVCIFIVVVMAYTSFKVKQEKCDGRFNLQDHKITVIEKDIDEVKTGFKEIKTTTDKIQETVDGFKNGLEDLIDGKYKKKEFEETSET